MCLKNENCKDCDYVFDCPHSKSDSNTKKESKVGISTHTIHLATRYENKETAVLINDKEYPIEKIICKGNKVFLVVKL